MYLKEKAAGLDMAGVPCNQWREKHHDTAPTGLILPRSQLSQCTMEILAAPPCNIQLRRNEKPSSVVSHQHTACNVMTAQGGGFCDALLPPLCIFDRGIKILIE